MQMLFIRHGKCALPYAIPEEGTLHELGIKQAKITGKALVDQGIERLFSSPYPRAMQTALYISKEIGLPVEIRYRIHEKSGPGDRATRSDIAAKFPQFLVPEDMPEVWWPDHAESWADVFDRVRPAVEEFKALEGKHERVAAVAHGGSIDAMLSVWIDVPPQIEGPRYHHHNCGFFLVSQTEGRSRINYVNRAQHLGDLAEFGIFFG